jgi:hypothetical protein
MPTESPSSRPSPLQRAARASPPRSSPFGPYRSIIRVLVIPVIAVTGVFIYSGLRDRFFLPECDSERARKTLSEVLDQLQLQPTRYEPIKTVSNTKEAIVCNAVMPLPDGGSVTVDYSFYWQGDKANMRYSISRKAPGSS